MEIAKKNTLFPGEFTIEVTLEDGTKHILGTFSDDQAAIDSIQAFEKREFGEVGVPDKHKTLSPFDFGKAFEMRQNPFDQMDGGQFEANAKSYSAFMINKYFSMNEENAHNACHIGKYWNVSNYIHSCFWANAAVKPRAYSQWAKADKKTKKEENEIKELQKEYGLSKHRAEEYLEVLKKLP